MHRWNESANSAETGRASLEFLVAAVVLLIPVMFLGMSLSSIHNATLAAETAARNAARVFVAETSLSVAAQRAETAVWVALANHGIRDIKELSRKCSVPACLSPGSVVNIRVGVTAPLISSDFLPGFLGQPSVEVFGEASSVVSIFGGTP
jgi:hypothetical protein